MELTGNKRHRRNWRGKMILQVEVVFNHMDNMGGTGYYDQYQTKHWRDAKWDEVA